MKKLITFCLFIATTFGMNAQQKSDSFGNWKFVQSDKAIQYRFKKEKQDGDVVYLKMQFKLNKTDEIFCKEPECKG